MNELCFSIPGPPWPKERPRLGKGRVYTPKGTVKAERAIGVIAKSAMREQKIKPFTNPVQVEMYFYVPMPESWTRAKKLRENGKPVGVKPDLDNYQKSILDGMNKIVFDDDGLVASIRAEKRYAFDGFTRVRVWEWIDMPF